MSTLMQSGPINKMTLVWVGSNVVAHRGSHGNGFTCRCCGNYTHSNADMAQVIGVGASTISKWLKREPIRQDLADRIRSAFLRVEE